MIRKDIKFFTCSQICGYTFVNRENAITDCNTITYKGIFPISIIYYLSIISTQPFTSLHTIDMEPKGDPNPMGIFRPRTPLENFVEFLLKQREGKIGIG